MDKGRVLVVDDDDSWVGLVSKWLELEGHQVVTASNGVDALDTASHSSPALIVLDLVLPRMNGLQCLEALKQHPNLKHVPVVIVSGLRDPHNFKRASELGVADILVKPIDEQKLLASVRSALAEA